MRKKILKATANLAYLVTFAISLLTFPLRYLVNTALSLVVLWGFYIGLRFLLPNKHKGLNNKTEKDALSAFIDGYGIITVILYTFLYPFIMLQATFDETVKAAKYWADKVYNFILEFDKPQNSNTDKDEQLLNKDESTVLEINSDNGYIKRNHQILNMHNNPKEYPIAEVVEPLDTSAVTKLDTTPSAPSVP